MLNKGICFLLILVTVGTISCMPCKQGAENLEAVPWADVRAEIVKYICVEVNTYPGGKVGYSFNHGTREPCVADLESTPLARAVETALENAQPLLLGIMVEYTGFVYDDSLPTDTTNSLLQESYLSSEIFLRPILNRLPRSLAKNCLRCLDLPVFEQKPIRTVAWSDFKAYLSAYAWPDPVRAQVDDDGTPTGKTEYACHVCVGINGVAEMFEEPDQMLSYIAGSIASNGRDFKELAFDQWRRVLKNDSLKLLETYSAKTQYLRQQVPERVAADKKLLPIACRFLEEHSDVLRIELDQCSADSP